TYLFVIDDKGIIRLHSAEPQKERQNIANIRDADGRQFLKNAISNMSDSVPNAWCFYRYNKPGEKQLLWKASYLSRVIGQGGQHYVIGSGVYNLHPDAILITEMVDRACELIKNKGKPAIDLIKDPKGSFVYRETFVLVADMSGKCLASAD